MSDSGSQQNKQGFWRHPAVQLLVPIVVPWLLTGIEDVKLEWAWNWIPEWVVSVGRWFNTPIGITPAWIISSIAAAFLVVRLLKAVVSRSSTAGPDMSFLDHITERIDGLQWKWNWQLNQAGKFDMENILALCPVCTYPMIWTTTNQSFGMTKHDLYCEDCTHTHPLDRSMYSMQDRIRRKVHYTLEQRANETAAKGS